MNYNRIKQHLWQNRTKTDWTGKTRLTVTFRIDIDSVKSEKDRKALSSAKNYADALKTPFTLNGYGRYIYFGGNVTAENKSDTLYILDYTRLIVKELKRSDVKWKLLTRYPHEAEFVGESIKEYMDKLQHYFFDEIDTL